MIVVLSRGSIAAVIRSFTFQEKAFQFGTVQVELLIIRRNIMQPIIVTAVIIPEKRIIPVGKLAILTLNRTHNRKGTD